MVNGKTIDNVTGEPKKVERDVIDAMREPNIKRHAGVVSQ